MTSSTPQSTRRFRQTSILIIEDNPDHWVIIRSTLQRILPGVKAVWVADAASALTYLNEQLAAQLQLPHLILLDLYLPDREQGINLLQQLKISPLRFRSPVVALTHSTDPQDVRDVYDAGGTSYLVKPTDGLQWLACFQSLKEFWWDVATLPH